MTIAPRKKAALDPAAFIAGAPDAGAVSQNAPKGGVRKGNKRQITHTIDDQLLADIDAFASQNGMLRAPAINMAIRQLLNRGVTVDPLKRGGE